MKRVLIALPILVLLLASSSLASQYFGLRALALPVVARWLLWMIEAAGLCGLFLIAAAPSDRVDRAGSTGSLSLGLAVGLAAWIFRGPVVATTLLAAGALGRSEARTLSFTTLLAYLACGLVLGWLGGRSKSPSP